MRWAGTGEELRRVLFADGAKGRVKFEAMLSPHPYVGRTDGNKERFVGKLVERGEIAEQDGKELVGDVMERRKKETKKAEGELDKRLEDLLNRMNVPTKGDINALSAKITELGKKVDELKEA